MAKKYFETVLDDVCIQITDGAHNSPKSVAQGLPMASVKDLTPYGINLNSCRYISSEDFAMLVRQGCKPKKGDVLIAKDGASALDTVCEFKKDINVVLLSSVAILRPDLNKVTSSYLHYFMDCSSTRQYLKGGFITGAAIPRVVLKDFKRCKISLPPLPIQRKIASILSAYDNLIENNTRRIAILEEMAQSLYNEWFVRFRFPGYEKNGIVESDLGLIPEGWEVGTLANAAKLSRDNIHPNKYADEIFDHYSLPAFDEGQIPTMDQGRSIMSNKYLIHEESLLLSKLNPRIPRIWMPVLSSARAVASTEFLIIVPKEPYAREFLYSLCKSAGFFDGFISMVGGTSTSHQRVKPEDFLKLPFVCPELTIIQKFTKNVMPIFKAIQNFRFKNTNLRRTRDLLLPKLISGEIDVEDLAIDTGEASDAEAIASQVEEFASTAP